MDLAIFALHLAGVSSLLGAINLTFFAYILINQLTLYVLRGPEGHPQPPQAATEVFLLFYYILFFSSFTDITPIRLYNQHSTSVCVKRFNRRVSYNKITYACYRSYGTKSLICREDKINKSEPKTQQFQSLHPWFITGYIDGVGCFAVKVRKSSHHSTG